MSGLWSGVSPRMDTNRHVFKRSWTLCLKYDNHLDSIVNTLRGLYGHSISTIIFTSITNNIFIRAPIIIKNSGYGLDLDLLSIVN